MGHVQPGSKPRELKATQWAMKCVLLLVTLGLIGGGTVYVVDAIEHQRNSVTKNRLKQIGFAIYAYHDAYDMYPPSITEGPGGMPWHSWRTLIVPYLEDPPEFDYRFDEPWNSEHNLAAAKSVGHRFQSADRPLAPGETNFEAPTGRRSMWQGPHAKSVSSQHYGAGCHLAVLSHPTRKRLLTEPEDMTTYAAIMLISAGGGEGGRLDRYWGLLGDGTALQIPARTTEEIAVRLMTTTRKATPLDQWPAYMPPIVPSEDSVSFTSIDAAADTSVEVLATADESLDPTTSSIWCATFEHAWSVAEAEFENPIRCAGTVPLCERLSTAAKQPPALTRDDVMTRVKRSDDNLEIDVRCELAKSMPFRDFYESIEDPLKFKGSKSVSLVESFGFTSGFREDRDPVFRDQLTTRFYHSPTRHVVELQTDGARRDRILLARIDPQETLWDTWETASKLSNKTPPVLRRMDDLQIPKFAFEVKNSFDSLVDRPLLGFARSERWTLSAANQTLRFKLDERGADLYSNARIVLLGSFEGMEAPPPEVPREFIYDGPFLLAAIEEGRERPYLLMWIANPTLLVKAEQNDGGPLK